MGGMTGQWLGIHQPRRLDRLVLANTAARIGTFEGWSTRAAQVRQAGMIGVADGAAGRWFTPAFIAREPNVVGRMIGHLRDQDPEGYAACCDALARADLRSDVRSIAVPTLVVAGAHDPVTTVDDGRWLANAMPDAALAVVPASHLSNIEAGQAFTDAVQRFLSA
jgi:3-oxoadipate enol-lactonase